MRTAAELGIKAGDRCKYVCRYATVIELSPCGRYVRIQTSTSSKRQWVAAEAITTLPKT